MTKDLTTVKKPFANLYLLQLNELIMNIQLSPKSS